MSTITGPLPQNYRDWLKREFEARCARNTRYSLRAFARDLGVEASRLSHVMKGHYGLSRPAAEKLSLKAGWSEGERSFFCDLVEKEHARSDLQRELAGNRLKKPALNYSSLKDDSFRVIADWYHFAILELTRTEDFKSDPKWIARELEITTTECEGAIRRLVNLGLLKRSGKKLISSGENFANSAGTSSEAIRRFNSQFLSRALLSLNRTPVEKRDFSTLTLAVSDEDLPDAKKMLNQFLDEFDARFSKTQRKTQVYGLGLQFFPLRSGTQ